jgi:hypothetical protein
MKMLRTSLLAIAALAVLAATMPSSVTDAKDLTGKRKKAPDAHPTVILQRLAVPKQTGKSGPGVYRSMDGASTWTTVRP